MPKRITSFDDIKDEFLERVHSAVWCNVATVDQNNRPRSRVLHPIWEGSTGWICVNRHSLKSQHLNHNSYVSLAYIAEPIRPVYAECEAHWAKEAETKERVWNLFKQAPEPLGYDPGSIWGEPQNPEFGLLRLQPWLIRLYDLMDQDNHRIWRAA